jgi:hypothetical protein
MQQCLLVMHDDTHDQVLVAFNIWDVTITPLKKSHPEILEYQNPWVN